MQKVNDTNEQIINEQVTGERVIIVKDYTKRKTIASFSAFWVFILFTIPISLPFIVIFGENLNVFIAVFITIISSLLATVWALRFTGQTRTWRKALLFNKPKRKHLIISALIGIGLFVLLQLIAFVSNKLFGFEVTSSETSDMVGSLSGFTGIILLFLFVPFIVPFVEEVLFRGVIGSFIRGGNWRKTKTGVITGVILSGVYFGFAHFQGLSNFTDVLLIIFIAIIGIINSVIVYKTNNLWNAVVIHVVYNLVTAITIYVGTI